MEFRKVTVIGTECMGVSVALGLKAANETTRIVLHAPGATSDERNHAKGLFDEVARKPANAYQDSDLVIVAQPLNRIESAFETIAPYLAPGAFVSDTAHLKAPVLEWASEHLPKEVNFLGGHPIANPKAVGVNQPSAIFAADPALLKGALYCFTAPDKTSELAVDTFSKLASDLEAEPFFTTAEEHDGLRSAVEDLPHLLALALVRGTMTSPAWRDVRRFAGYRFAAGIEAARSSDSAEDTLCLLSNRETAVMRINLMLRELVALRDILSTGNADDIAQMEVEVNRLRDEWLSNMNMGVWDEDKYPDLKEVPKSGDHVLGRMFFGEGMMRRLNPSTDPRREN
jgi:prephenate dehydrogenase